MEKGHQNRRKGLWRQVRVLSRFVWGLFARVSLVRMDRGPVIDRFAACYGEPPERTLHELIAVALLTLIALQSELEPGAPAPGAAAPVDAEVDAERDVERARTTAAATEALLGTDHPDVARDLTELAYLLHDVGDYSAARPVYERALAIREAALGADHPDTAESLENFGNLLQDLGEFSAAQSHYERALAITVRALGPDHPDSATRTDNLAVLLRLRGEFDLARPLFERALAVTEATLGPNHPDTATSLDHLAGVLQDLGEYEDARPLYERALEITARTLGRDHPDMATSEYNLAGLLRLLGEHEAARPLAEHALETCERELGANHPHTSEVLGLLAGLLHDLDDFDAALPLAERALSIRETAFGPAHPETADSLNHLATLHHDLGDYVAARPLYERALAVREEALGPDHTDTATSLENLGNLHQDLADYAAARTLYERALAITEAALGSDHPETATRLDNLASVLQDLEEFEAARPLYERALAIAEATLGPDHLDTAVSLNNLADLLQDLEQFGAARPLYERALAITELALGPDHADTASSLDKLGRLLHDIGEFDAALPLIERALAISEDVLGVDHPYAAISRDNLARIQLGRGDAAAAWEISGRGRERRRLAIEHTLTAQSEGESFRYVAALLAHLELRLSLVEHLDEDSRGTAAVEAYSEFLDWKGRIARMLLQSRERLARNANSEERALLDALREKQGELSRLALLIDVVDRTAHARQLDELRAERNRIEVDLNRAATSSAEATKTSVLDVRTALPDDSAVIDFFVHRHYSTQLRDFTEPRVTAWITRPDRDDLVRLDLGPAAEIEEVVQSFLSDLVIRRGRAISFASDDPDAKTAGVAGDALRERLWGPLAPHLDGVTTVIVSPDGVLGTLPFETISRDSGAFLIEEYSFIYVPDVVSLTRPSDPDAAFDSLFCVGAVDFDARSGEARKPGLGPIARVDSRADESGPAIRAGFFDFWDELPATRYESSIVFKMHSSAFRDGGRRALVQGADATEDRLKEDLGNFAVLHLATHGFFDRSAGALLHDDSDELAGMHPGLMSGLVCAGVNFPVEGIGEDGYLTAEEVGWLDLTRVEMVVLSACQTGLGKPESGEGLIGLRRAFQTAGAQTVISSLWSVNDDSTSELMQRFYRNLFLKRMPRHAALRAAQLLMLSRNRAQYDRPIPSTWGAFVLSGEWR